MKLFRLAKKQYATDILGTGGLYFSGRWHRKGVQILYTSQHASLAVLEILANSERLPQNEYLVTFQIPANATILELTEDKLPKNWKNIPYPDDLASFSEKWIQKSEYWILKVPSIHASNEFNFLLNPLHSEHKTLEILSIEQYTFDTRLKS
jgi:RES domain-containing protein